MPASFALTFDKINVEPRTVAPKKEREKEIKKYNAFKLETSLASTLNESNESITSHSNATDVNNYYELLICLEAFIVLLQLPYLKYIFNDMY